MADSNAFGIAGLLGYPVAHSRSPVIHNHWLAEHGIAGRYVLFPVPPEKLEAAVRGLSALGMYMLLPTQPPAELLPFVVIFVLATLLGFISHTPGALGVFDAAILLALSQYPREELLATLLVFRFIYYVIPFTLALCTMATREFWLASRPTRPERTTGTENPAGRPI